MEKVEAVSKLKKAGYQVQFDSSVVTVVLPPKVNTNQEIKKLKNFFDEIGYHSSFGIKQVKGNISKENSELQDLEMIQEERTVDIDKIPEEGTKEVSDSSFEETEFVEIGEQFSLEDFGIS